MALQGTLEDFGLDEVLAMLGAGGKAGRLRVSGPAGTGSIWVDAGRVVGSALGGDDVGPDHAETLFHLLRLNDGEFAFLPGERPGSEVEEMAVPDVLAQSSERIDEWREIEQVLPSLEHWLVLSTTIDEPVTIEPDDWEIVACIGPGRRIATVVRALGKGLVPGARDIVTLVQSGVLTVTEDTPPEAGPVSPTARTTDGELERQLPSVGAPDPEPPTETEPAEEPAFDLFGRADAPSAGFDPAIPSPSDPPASAPTDDWPTAEPPSEASNLPAVIETEPVVAPEIGSAQEVSAPTSAAPGLPAITPPRPPAPAAETSDASPAPVSEAAEEPQAESESDETEVNPRALLRLLNSVR